MKPYLFIILVLSITASLPMKAKEVAIKQNEALSAQEQLKRFTLPEGFIIELVASEENGLINPIDLTFDDAGRLWTQTGRMYPLDLGGGIPWSDLGDTTKIKNPKYQEIKDLYQLKTRSEDKILIIDEPGKQVQGKISAFAEGLTIPQSVLPYKNGVYVAHGSEMLYLEDTNQDGEADRHETVLSGFGFNDTHTMSHSLVRAPGGWIHFSQGALNEGHVTVIASRDIVHINRSKIIKFSLDEQKIEIINNGLNNIWGFQLKASGQWYGTEANDKVFSVTPMHPMMGYSGIGNQKLRDYQPFTPKVNDFLVGESAISGLAFDENGSRGVPKEWQNVALLASPMSNQIKAVKIDRLADGTIVSERLEDFLSCSDEWFRPVNIEFGPDGFLYIIDWYNKIISHNEVSRQHPDRDKSHGRIWHVRHESQKLMPTPDLTKVANSKLIEHLSAEILWEKRAAWQQIVDRQATELISSLVQLASNAQATPVTRIHAAWALEGLDSFNEPLIKQLLTDENADIPREALRSLASYNLSVEDLVNLVEPLMTDSHYMVREQVLRILAAANEANEKIIKILVTACESEIKGNNFGESYERNFQRFLARKALEQYPEQLATFLNSAAAKTIPLANIEWASQALSGDNKLKSFLKMWGKKGKELDLDTLVSIADLLNNVKVCNAIKPQLANEKFLKLALEGQDRLNSKSLHKALKPGLKKLIASSSVDQQNLAMEVAIKFQTAAINKEVFKIIEKQPVSEISIQHLDVLAIKTQEYVPFIESLANNEKVGLNVRLYAINLLASEQVTSAISATTNLLNKSVNNTQAPIILGLSNSTYGSEVLLGLIKSEKVDAKSLDTALIERIISIQPSHPITNQLSKEVQVRIAKESKEQDAQIIAYTKAVEELEGNPIIGEALFNACLACHQAGGKGYNIAPALDGSVNREVEALVTAIVKPNAAVESGYQLYRIIKKNGEILEGYQYKKGDYGTIIAYMGGTQVFVPNIQIQKQGYLSKNRSFMPANFGNLPEKTMVDIISYIKTLK